MSYTIKQTVCCLLFPLYGLLGQHTIDTLAFQITNEKTIFVLTKTEGFVHKEAIIAGKKCLQKMGLDHQFNILHSQKSEYIETLDWTKIDAIVFLCTTLDILNEPQQKIIENYIQNGGGYVGIHSAADTEYDWPWYGQLMGGYFESHPPGTPSATITTLDVTHPLTNHLPKTWHIQDEWYNYRFKNNDIIPLLNLEESSYEGGKNGKNHPIAWYHSFEGGRSFYIGLGHRGEVYQDSRFVSLVLKGLNFAMDNL